jgi:hypothetical protein
MIWYNYIYINTCRYTYIYRYIYIHTVVTCSYLYSSYNIHIHFTLHAGFLHASSRRSMIVLFDLYDKVQDVGSDVSASRCNEIRHLILNYAPVSETTSITYSHIYIYDYILHIYILVYQIIYVFYMCMYMCMPYVYVYVYVTVYIYTYAYIYIRNGSTHPFICRDLIFRSRHFNRAQGARPLWTNYEWL